MELDGKVVLITGAGKGAGHTLARLFAARGAYVAANDISPVNLDGLVREGGGKIRAYPEDMAKKVGVQAVIKQVEDDFGRIDLLINHAAVEPHTALLDMDEWDWHRVLDVNLTGAFLATQSAGRIMRQNGSGCILHLIHLADESQRRSAAYAASMYALVAFTHAAAAELGQYGVFVHAVGRGILELEDAVPAVPRSLNEAVLYLWASSLNGQVVNVEAS